MPRVVTTVSFAGFFAFAAPDVANAQICTGQAEFGRYALQASLSAEFNHDAKSYGGGIAVGGRRPFVGLAAARTTLHDLNGSKASFTTMGGGVGYQLPVGRKGALTLCPIA